VQIIINPKNLSAGHSFFQFWKAITLAQSKIHIHDIPIFQPLDSDARHALQSIARLYMLQPDERLFNRGDRAHCLYVIQRGGVRLLKNTQSGKAVSIKIHGVGDLFGLLAISGEYEHRATIEAIDHTEIIALRGSLLRTVMKDHPSIALLVMDWLVNHVHEAHERIQSLAVERTERRIAQTLLHFYRKFGHKENSECQIDVELSQQDVAEFTGTTPETVNRYLKQWEQAGLVRLSRQHIDILDYAELAEVAEQNNYPGYLE
jgi:CRP-like cAMP-binding protein